ncbi:MAG: urease accessory protein [Alphaproteobacteria bacterium]|jgi:urease accessory protein|nr:urease accessory protein [Alphaproteobacteria bacterium]
MSAITMFFALAVLTLLAEPAAAHHVMGGRMATTFGEGFLSGLGHPILGLDHLAAIVAVGCIAASQMRGAMLVVGFVIAMMAGTAAHVGEATIPASEILVALSVIVLGLVMLLRSLSSAMALTLFALAGFFHGYALGESIAGAEPTPLYAYLAGLAIIQSGIALAAMTAVRRSTARPAFEPAKLRLIGAGIVGIGLAVLAQQIVPGA